MEKQYQNFDNTFESNKNEEDKIKNERNRTKSNLVYNNYFTFCKYNNSKEFAKHSFDLKRNDLKEFKDILELFYYDTIEIQPNNEHKIKDIAERKVVLNRVFELYNKLPDIYKTQYDKFTKAHKKRIKVQNVPKNVRINSYLDEDDLPPMPSPEGDEEV